MVETKSYEMHKQTGGYNCTYGRDSGENFTNVKLIEYGGFPSCIQPKHHHLRKKKERPFY
jgi:hypothetical protein